jgi:hypothetical protein
MRREDFGPIIYTIQTYYRVEFSAEEQELYFEFLRDLDSRDVALAVRKVLSEHIYNSAPKPAAIRKAVAELRAGPIPTPSEAWGMTLAAARKHGDAVRWIQKGSAVKYYAPAEGRKRIDSFETALSELPRFVAAFLKSCGRDYWSALCREELDAKTQSRFEWSFSSFVENRVEEVAMLPDVKDARVGSLISGVTEALRLK